VIDLLPSSVMSTEPITRLRNDFREAFQEYLKKGERMAELLRASGDHITPEHRIALKNQQEELTACLHRYEAARQKYVEAVMGQLAGLSAMGLKVQ
jgi:hypothetical protein